MADEFHLEFINECREHLASIESDLLAIEEAGAGIDEDRVNKVFRAAHSIKGGSSFFGWHDIKELAHKAETVLDLVRERKITPNAEVTNLLLAAFDRLRDMINSPDPGAGGEVDDLLLALTTLAASYLPEEQKGAITRQVEIPEPDQPHTITVAQVDLDRAARSGQCVYVVDFDLIHDVDRKGLDLLHVFREIAGFGEIFDCLMNFAAVGTLDHEIGHRVPLRMVLASSLAPELMPEVLGVPKDRIHLLLDPCKSDQVAAIPALPATEAPRAIEIAPVPPPAAAAPELPSPVRAAAPAVPPGPVAATPIPPGPEAPVAEPTAAAARRTPPAERAGAGAAAATGAEETLRVHVSVLESLMNLAGELVLGRNQLRSAITRNDAEALQHADQRLNQVTTELQDAVMRTRLQPIGNVFGKFPRVVRDLAATLGKDVELDVRGRDVALDRTLLEGLSDPLTHMVRNAVDHGIETAADRRRAGKRPTGVLRIEARHEAGQVVVEIADDGKGIDPERIARSAVKKGLITEEKVRAMTETEKRMLIFLPGLSTAEKVTDVSGRGVGMDVVKTNLDRLGGKVEIKSQVGQGSLFRIKLPLTLAIMPAMIVSLGSARFALPQVNVEELLRIRPEERAGRFDIVGGVEVMELRGQVIPVVRLARLLGATEEPGERDSRPAEVAVLNTGTQIFALVVGEFHDTEEIVVKPLGRHLEGMREYAGATILGDGRVALILDAGGLALKAGLAVGASERGAAAAGAEAEESRSLLLFHNAPQELCALPLQAVVRIERISPTQIESFGGRRTMQYRDAALPLVALQDVAAVGAIGEEQELAVIVARVRGCEVGLLGALPVDVLVTAPAKVDATHRRPGIAGSLILQGRTALVLEIDELMESILPAAETTPEPLAAPFTSSEPAVPPPPAAGPAGYVLLAEDSDFFRMQVRSFLEAEGFAVVDAPDGEAAWELLQAHAADVRLIVTDIEMPRLDGVGFARRVRADDRFRTLPIVAMSSLAADEDVARSRAAGINQHLVKLDRDQLTMEVRSLLAASVAA